MENFTLGNDVVVEGARGIEGQANGGPTKSGEEILKEVEFQEVVKESE